MRLIALMSVAGATLVAACDFQPGDPVQHALRDAAAARQAAALKTTEEEQAQAVKRAPAPPSVPAADQGDDELSRLIATRRQAVADTRALLETTTDPSLRDQLSADLKAEEERLRALEARTNNSL